MSDRSYFNNSFGLQTILQAFTTADESLMYSNIPEASVLFYRYETVEDNILWSRDKTSDGFVGSAFIFQDSPRDLFIEARQVTS